MLIQLKPKEAGKPVDAIQFFGSITSHPCIVWADNQIKVGDKDRWCVKSGLYLIPVNAGDWIVGINSLTPCVVPREEFERDWQIVPA